MAKSNEDIIKEKNLHELKDMVYNHADKYPEALILLAIETVVKQEGTTNELDELRKTIQARHEQKEQDRKAQATEQKEKEKARRRKAQQVKGIDKYAGILKYMVPLVGGAIVLVGAAAVMVLADINKNLAPKLSGLATIGFALATFRYFNKRHKLYQNHKYGTVKETTEYHYNGSVKARGKTRWGLKHGKWEYFDIDGQFLREDIYEDGQLISSKKT